MSVKSAIYKRLIASAELEELIGSAIFPEWRDEVEPALVYSVRMDDLERSYVEGILATSWELTIGVVHKDEDKANEIADLVIGYLDHTGFSDGTTFVLGCFLRSRDESSVAKTTQRVRLATVELTFELEANEQEVQ